MNGKDHPNGQPFSADHRPGEDLRASGRGSVPRNRPATLQQLPPELQHLVRHAASPSLIALCDQAAIRRYLVSADADAKPLRVTARVSRDGVRSEFPLDIQKTPTGQIQLHSPRGWQGLRPIAFSCGPFPFPDLPTHYAKFTTGTVAVPPPLPGESLAAEGRFKMAADGTKARRTKISWDGGQTVLVRVTGRIRAPLLWGLLTLTWTDCHYQEKCVRRRIRLKRTEVGTFEGRVRWHKPPTSIDGELVMRFGPIEHEDLDALDAVDRDQALSDSTKFLSTSAHHFTNCRLERTADNRYLTPDATPPAAANGSVFLIKAIPTADPDDGLLEGERALCSFRLSRSHDDFRQALVNLAEWLEGLIYTKLTPGDPALADEIAQETWAIAYIKLPQTDYDTSLRGWLYRVATNIFLKQRKQRKRCIQLPAEAGDEVCGAARQDGARIGASSNQSSELHDNDSRWLSTLNNLESWYYLLKVNNLESWYYQLKVNNPDLTDDQFQSVLDIADPERVRELPFSISWKQAVWTALNEHTAWFTDDERRLIKAAELDDDNPEIGLFSARWKAACDDCGYPYDRQRVQRIWQRLQGGIAICQLQRDKLINERTAEVLADQFLRPAGSQPLIRLTENDQREFTADASKLHAAVLRLRRRRRDTRINDLDRDWLARVVLGRKKPAEVAADISRTQQFARHVRCKDDEDVAPRRDEHVARWLHDLRQKWTDTETIVPAQYRTWQWDVVPVQPAVAIE